MATLAEIEQMTKDFADSREKLAGTVRTLEDKIEALKRQYLPGIKKQVALAAAKKLDLRNAIEDSKDLFKRPRTVIFHGIKVGMKKGKGKIEFDKSEIERIVRLIEKHFPEQADVLIQTKKTPVKEALGNLTVAELKKLGIEVEDTGDSVVIKPTDSQIEKLVEALLKEKDDEAETEEAA
ncbi:MAG: host-nuclease inhibitor Gam family protein [Syntrophales bacterium]